MRLFVRTIVAAILLLAFQDGQGALAQAWWTSVQERHPAYLRSRPACRTTAIRPASASGLADHGIVYGLEYTNDRPVERARRHPHRHDRPGQVSRHSDRRFRQACRLAGAYAVRQLLSNPQHRPDPARLRRRHQHHRGDRGGADHAAFGNLAGAEIRRRQGEHPARPARRRRRILLQRDQHAVPAKRLADHHRAELAERRTGLSAVDAWRAAARSSRVSDVSLLLAVFNGDPAGPGPERPIRSFATATA